MGHSPAQAVGPATLEEYAAISHETAYKWIYADKKDGDNLWQKLRCCKKRRMCYGSGRQRRGRIIGRVGIEQRCPCVETRSTVGHWEGDTVIGRNHKYDLVTLAERKTGFALVRKVPIRQASAVVAAIIDALKPFRNLVRTIIFDEGLEFAYYARIIEAIGAKVYCFNCDISSFSKTCRRRTCSLNARGNESGQQWLFTPARAKPGTEVAAIPLPPWAVA